MSWTRGPYGGEGWRLNSGGNFECEHGLSPMSSGEVEILRSRISPLRRLISDAARKEGALARSVAAIGWSETRLQNLGANSAGASGMFGILPSTATWLEGRTVTAAELAKDTGLSARLCARFLVKAAKATGYDAKNPAHLPILASAYNAGFGKGKIRESSSTPFRMVYDKGTDGGYLPRVMRAWNALDTEFLGIFEGPGFGKGLLVVGVCAAAVAGVLIARARAG